MSQTPLRYSIGIGTILLTLSGCAIAVNRFGHEPSSSAQAIVPGVTTRSDVLALMGPPEEHRMPTAGEQGRQLSPQVRRIDEELNLYDFSTYSYGCEQRVEKTFNVLPGVLSVLSFSWSSSREDRVLIRFDSNDVVESVGFVNEIDHAERDS